LESRRSVRSAVSCASSRGSVASWFWSSMREVRAPSCPISFGTDEILFTDSESVRRRVHRASSFGTVVRLLPPSQRISSCVMAPRAWGTAAVGR
jgi:hypothetical protein